MVISEAPLNVVRVSERAVKILHLCDGRRTLRQIADEIGISDEAQLFNLCEYFNKKSFLETCVTPNAGYFPAVSVIIPTRDRGRELVQCLESVYAQDYPANGIEIIVVDDGSVDETKRLAGDFPCKLLSNPASRGQSFCRNLGVRAASGEVLAFLDDDCVASRTWLRDLVVYLQWDALGAVGGYVDGYADRNRLERYERAFSRLNLGRYILHGTQDRSNFYIPACNLLVRKKAYLEAGGTRETMHLGEDVDFCWRLRDIGWRILYVPSGIVMHKHRNTPRTMMKRRADYGMSEATLCLLHPQRIKTLQMRPLAAGAFGGACLSVVLLSLLPLVLTGACFVFETGLKAFRLRRQHIRVSYGTACHSVLRMYIAYAYATAFHLSRYYLLLLFLTGLALPSLWGLGFCVLMLSASVDYSVKRPRLPFPAFLFYYILDHISYQVGVLAGCLRAASFRPFRIHLSK
jgi:mycofactocin system glycosyltransferase